MTLSNNIWIKYNKVCMEQTISCHLSISDTLRACGYVEGEVGLHIDLILFKPAPGIRIDICILGPVVVKLINFATG